MANPDLPFGALQKGPPLAVARRQRRANDAQALREAYADVDSRDGGFCWATGRYTVAGSVDARNRREHHHLKGRNVRPEWVFKPERIITLAAEVHQLVTAGWIDVEGCDARKPILFHWDRKHVKPGKEPFALLRTR
jgi:hypothetical protein